MKKFRKLLSLALAVVMVCAVSVTAWAEEETRAPSDTKHVVNLMDVYEHPENYPDTELIVHKDINDYITALTQDENLSTETRDALIRDAMVTSRNSTRSTSYLTIRQTAVVTDTYSVYPYFYVKVEYVGSTSPDGMLEVKNANLDRKHNGKSKQFSGDLYYNLETSTCLYWDLNGDFYNNGSTTISGGGSIDVGGYGSATFSASTTTSHYAYAQESGEIRI